MRRGLVMGMVLGLLVGAAPAMADTLDDAAKRGSLKICVAEGAPYALMTPSGRWIGHEIDIGQRLATDFGLRPEFVPGSLADVIGRLNKGECDLVAASLAIEPDRLRQAWFTTPYSETDVSIVAARKGPVRIADLDKAGVVIGAVAGAPAILLAKSRLPAATIEVFPDLIAAERALEGGAITGLAHKAPLPRMVSVRAPDKYSLVEGEPLARTADAFAVRKGDADLLNTLNGWIEARKRDGFLDRTNSYWLSTLDWTERLKPRTGPAK